MKKILITLFLLGTISLQAQKAKYNFDAPKTKIELASGNEITNEYAQYKGESYPIYRTKKGREFIIYENKTGAHRKYLPKV